VNPKTKNKETNIKPVQSSTKGYCHDIFVLHSEHRPRSPTKLITGTSSHQRNFFLQTTQNDRPPIERPEFHLNPNTFKKLPIINPKINRNSVITYLLYQKPRRCGVFGDLKQRVLTDCGSNSIWYPLGSSSGINTPVLRSTFCN